MIKPKIVKALYRIWSLPTLVQLQQKLTAQLSSNTIILVCFWFSKSNLWLILMIFLITMNKLNALNWIWSFATLVQLQEKLTAQV